MGLGQLGAHTGDVNQAATLGTVWHFFKRLNIESSSDPAIPFLDRHGQDENTSAQPERRSTDERENRTWPVRQWMLFSSDKEQRDDTGYSTDGAVLPGWAATTDQTVHDCVYRKGPGLANLQRYKVDELFPGAGQSSEWE